MKLIVDVKVKNLTRAVKFYREVLGLTLITKAGEWASFKINGAEIHLYRRGGATTGVEFGVGKINEQVKILQKRGAKFFINRQEPGCLKLNSNKVMEFSWGRAVWFKDSEGNQLALVQDGK